MVSDTEQIKETKDIFSNFNIKRLTNVTHGNIHLSFADLIEGSLLS